MILELHLSNLMLQLNEFSMNILLTWRLSPHFSLWRGQCQTGLKGGMLRLCMWKKPCRRPHHVQKQSAGMHAGHEHETRWTHRVHLFARSSTTSSTPCHFSLNKQTHPVIEIFDELHSPIPQHAGYYSLSGSGYYLIKH